MFLSYPYPFYVQCYIHTMHGKVCSRPFKMKSLCQGSYLAPQSGSLESFQNVMEIKKDGKISPTF